MITDIGIKKIAETIGNIPVKGRIIVDGSAKDIEIYKRTIEGSKLTIHLLIDDTISGNITKKELVDVDNNTIFENAMAIEKSVSDGLLISFEINIKEVIDDDSTEI